MTGTSRRSAASSGTVQRAVTVRAASLLLRYPDAEVLAALPTLRRAVATLPDRLAEPLLRVADHYAHTPPTDLACSYVDTFDFRRRCCLYLTYYTAGDTRRRGIALVEFASAYRAVGLTVADGELPDFLPAVLDLAAADEVGWRLLRNNRVGLDLLAQALAQHGSVYRHAVETVRRLLPPAGPDDLAAAASLARTGPPQEVVGRQPYPTLGGPAPGAPTIGARP